MIFQKDSNMNQKKIAIFTLDTRFFFLHHSLKLRKIQNILESILPYRILRLGGPRSVLESVVIGAKRSNWKVVLNPKSPGLEFEIVLNLSRVDIIDELSRRFKKKEIKNLFLGPNIDLKSTNNLQILSASKYSNVLVPSKWTKDLFENWEPSSFLRTAIWDAGVDIEYWKPPKNKKKDGILIYIKGTQNRDLSKEFSSALSKFYPIRILNYGEHSREKFRKFVSISEAVIWLGTTETQGLAICEAWALGTPTFVLEQPWRHILGSSWPSSSAPYLTDKTGLFINDINDVKVALVGLRADKYKPRDWVLRNQTSELSFNRLLKLI